MMKSKLPIAFKRLITRNSMLKISITSRAVEKIGIYSGGITLTIPMYALSIAEHTNNWKLEII